MSSSFDRESGRISPRTSSDPLGGALSRRGFLKTMAAATTVAALGRVASADDQGDKPNIVFIITDQQAGMAMSSAGAKWLHTPNMDRIASWGTMFRQAYCANPLCVPSRASLFTGRRPAEARPAPQKHPSLGRLVGRAGYETAYFGKWHIGKTKPDEVADWHGFETCKTGVIDSTTSADAVDFIRREHERPFFAVVSYLNPHDCCEYAREKGGWETRIRMRNGAIDTDPPLDQCPPLPENFAIPQGESEALTTQRTDKAWDFLHPTQEWGEREWRQYRWGYGRLVEKVDAEIGKVLDALDQAGELENTLIVFTSDHGDGASAHQWNQKLAFYDEVVRVPLLVARKGTTPAGRTDDHLVNTGLDLVPTLCEQAGAETPAGGTGRSFLPFTRPGAKARGHSMVVSEVEIPMAGRMVRTDRYKYICYEKGADPEMLFDCRNDPGELKNLIADASATDALQRHRKMLRDWCARTGDSFALPAANSG